MTAIEHGTLVGYKIQRCRCTRCRQANNRYVKRRERLIGYGQWKFLIDAEPIREHIARLQAAGLGWKRATNLAGVSTGTVAKILYGVPSQDRPPARRVHPDTAAALLAVHADLDTLADLARIDAAGTRRRAQALACLGWSLGEQARRLGWTNSNYSTTQRRPKVSTRTARAVRALYDELSMTPAPDSRAATRAQTEAARKGYLPPLAWDDDLIDLPDAELAEELKRRAAAMDDEETVRCNTARRRGDRSPLIVAGAREHDRRLREAQRAQEVA